MTIHKKIISIFLALISIIVGSFAYSQTNIAGDYKCTIYDPKNNINFTENLSITKTGEAWRLEYYKSDAPTAHILGTGILTGNALSVTAWEPSSSWEAVILFAIKGDGSLDGTWAAINSKKLGTQTCTKK